MMWLFGKVIPIGYFKSDPCSFALPTRASSLAQIYPPMMYYPPTLFFGQKLCGMVFIYRRIRLSGAHRYLVHTAY